MVYKPCSQYSKIIDFSELSSPDQEWKLIQSIGEGTYGEVFQAKNLLTGKVAAVKVMESYNELVEEIEEEYMILRDLSTHSNLPDFYGIYLKKNNETEDDKDDQLWLVLELCSNGSVTDLVKTLIKSGRSLSEDLIAHIIRQTILAIEHLHKNYVIHRDIKGHNILITETGSIKLIDFGVSTHLKSSIGRCNTSVGTPFWMAPEVIACEQQMECDYDFRCDIWSLGITAIELADGEPPLSDLHPMRALFKIPRNPPPSLLSPNEWSQEYNDFIKTCLVKDFEKRPSATNLLEHPFLEKAARNQKELESDLKELVEWERQNMDNLNKKPDVTTKHGQFKSKRKSKRYLPQTANDLATLESFDEDSIVAQLFNRFMQGQIYTYIGDILLAVNPFTNINIYSNKWSKKYETEFNNEQPPHIFAIAYRTYKSMMNNNTNQCIIISGESGSGKTESANFLIQQLTVLGKAPSKCLEEKILQVNPLIEAFGNAKTVINNNSSRFGKYLDMIFTKNGQIIGAQLHEYLLEKSRVVSQALGERNFHIFYYMFDGLESDSQKRKYHLSHDIQFKYLSDVDTSLSGINCNKFQTINNCFETIGFKSQEVNSIYSLLAGILHLGNLTFLQDEGVHNDGKCHVSNKHSLNIISQLLGVDEKELQIALTECYIVTAGETLTRSNSMQECHSARDSMSKGLYGRLFSWIVNKINLLLQPLVFETENNLSISLLDIFGFENFPRNSFEQLCINIANEQIQYYFNQHVFAWEMQEYMNEGIDGSNIAFVDNRPVLDMFLAKPMGLLALLDEESRFPRANDSTLVEKFHRNIKSSCYLKPKSNELTFTINHYAGNIQYDATGLLEKNKDYVPTEIISLLRQSEISLIRSLFRSPLAKTGNLIYGSLKAADSIESFDSSTNSNVKYARSHGSHKNIDTSFSRSQATVSTYFRFSLMDLLTKMVAGAPHFVRCIRPNKHKIPGYFDSETVSIQLKCTGVLETTKIRRLGYSYRITFDDFLKRYWTLAYPITKLSSSSNKENCLYILQKIGLKNWKLGKTKIFLKYYHAEQLINLKEKLLQKIVTIQCAVRKWLAKRRLEDYKEKRNNAIQTIQRYYRGYQVRKIIKAKNSKYLKAAVTIQAAARGYLARNKYKHQKSDLLQNERKKAYEKILKSVETIQKYWRGFKIRKLYKEASLERASQQMQLGYFYQQIGLLSNEFYYSIIKSTYKIFPNEFTDANITNNNQMSRSVQHMNTAFATNELHNISCIHCISGQILVPANTPILVSSCCSPIDSDLPNKHHKALSNRNTQNIEISGNEIENNCELNNQSSNVNLRNKSQKCFINSVSRYYETFAIKNVNQKSSHIKNRLFENAHNNIEAMNISASKSYDKSKYISNLNKDANQSSIERSKKIFEPSTSPSKIPLIKTPAPSMDSLSNSDDKKNNSDEDSETKYNFRAFLRKTGQDLTSGSTLSKNRANIEARQVDFRNVLKKNTAKSAPTKIEVDKMKLIQRLILTKVIH